ncbi:uncharacterized protein LOC119366116 [Triticum dicoccoides]|uniref:uncharacterized protein LOC119366116 n=1 Tax=Triticum dicoccoides TaxID=85692 RepID=UPI00188E4A38|nr:uncharacterized protein LOC119366116 [Triticum dicoccoides]
MSLSSTSLANAVHHVAWIPIQPAILLDQVPPPVSATTWTTTCPVIVACGCPAHRRLQDIFAEASRTIVFRRNEVQRKLLAVVELGIWAHKEEDEKRKMVSWRLHVRCTEG